MDGYVELMYVYPILSLLLGGIIAYWSRTLWWVGPLIVLIAQIVLMYTLYNSTYWPYVPIHTLIALFGSWIGIHWRQTK